MRSAIKPEFNEVHIEGQIFMASKPEIDRLTPDPAVNAWFEAAKESIKAAEVTYENALYPTSIFNCQQAIEKLVKVLLLSSGVSDDMKAIGHTPHKTLKEFYEKVGDCSKIERCSSLDKIIENNTRF